VECFIAVAHAEMRVRGQEVRVRDEAAGAARYLCDLRDQIIDKTREKAPVEEGKEEE